MKTFLALCCVTAGFAVAPSVQVQAASAAVSVGALPEVVHMAPTVVLKTGRRHYHRRYRTVRKVYFRNGRKVVVYRKVYY